MLALFGPSPLTRLSPAGLPVIADFLNFPLLVESYNIETDAMYNIYIARKSEYGVESEARKLAALTLAGDEKMWS